MSAAEVTAADHVARNSHELTAHLLVTAQAELIAEHRRHALEVQKLRDTLDAAQRVGLAVMRARRTGRKMVRVDDLMCAADSASVMP